MPNTNDNKRLEEIKSKANSANSDVSYLLELVEMLQKKNEILNQHNMELTQEIENTKSDFGNNR